MSSTKNSVRIKKLKIKSDFTAREIGYKDN